ncbi:unnamed protein product [Protopolystoma xenopodis]|uniref:Uncharacterized protein n=1 Tax=Protopolystoma xenopodis TaxID=117903 RepID=A0A448X601_9PLAT|nr:unnamed protein product [Protopolystoma xenopodis]
MFSRVSEQMFRKSMLLKSEIDICSRIINLSVCVFRRDPPPNRLIAHFHSTCQCVHSSSVVSEWTGQTGLDYSRTSRRSVPTKKPCRRLLAGQL